MVALSSGFRGNIDNLSVDIVTRWVLPPAESQ
jgi:hypothetical protein